MLEIERLMKKGSCYGNAAGEEEMMVGRHPSWLLRGFRFFDGSKSFPFETDWFDSRAD
jgi:hypothetical protein